MANLPPALAARVKGAVVASESPTFSEGLSMMGTRTVVFTDAPAAYIHDTGGFVASERFIALEGPNLGQCWRAYWQAQPQALKVELRGEGACVVTDLPVHFGAQVAERVLEPSVPSHIQRPWSGHVPFQASVDFAPGVSEDPEGRARIRQVLGDDNATLVNVFLDGGRLGIRDTQGQPLVDAPLDLVGLRSTGTSVEVTGRLVVCGSPAEKLTVYFATHARATALFGEWQAANAQGLQSGTALSLVGSVEGGLPGQPNLSGRVDIVLQDGGLELRNAATGHTHVFDLKSPACGVSGYRESLLLVDERLGPLLVKADSAEAQELLMQESELVSAAVRTAAKGPHLAVHAGRPIAVSTVPGSPYLEFRGENAPPPCPWGKLDGLEASFDGRDGTVELSADTDVLPLEARHASLRGLYASVQARATLDGAPAQNDALPKAILGREGDWILYSTLGPFAELHLELQRHFGGDGLAVVVPRPIAPEAAEQLVTMIGHRVPLFREHLDTVQHVLPSFIQSQDAQLCAEASLDVPAEIEAQRQGFESVVRAVGPLYAILARLERATQQNESVRKMMARTKPSYAGLATTLVGSAINPIFLLGAAQQAYSLTQGQAQRASQESTAALDCAETMLDGWNYAMGRLMPAVVNRLQRLAYPQRLRVAVAWSQRMGEPNPEQLFEALALRFGRLEAFARFPQQPFDDHPRAEAIGWLKYLPQKFEDSSFEPF